MPTISEPDHNCDLCPRLKNYIDEQRAKEPDWHNGPVPTWTDEDDNAVRLLIIGLAPGVRGANRTGRPFTGDFAGDLLYQTLNKFGFATGNYGATPDDSLKLKGAAITNAVRCVPPQNKPVGAEINTCRQFLTPTIDRFKHLNTIVTLGGIAHNSTLRALGIKVKSAPFGHNAAFEHGEITILSSYHCSRYNTNTGRLTETMFEGVFRAARNQVDAN